MKTKLFVFVIVLALVATGAGKAFADDGPHKTPAPTGVPPVSGGGDNASPTQSPTAPPKVQGDGRGNNNGGNAGKTPIGVQPVISETPPVAKATQVAPPPTANGVDATGDPPSADDGTYVPLQVNSQQANPVDLNDVPSDPQIVIDGKIGIEVVMNNVRGTDSRVKVAGYIRNKTNECHDVAVTLVVAGASYSQTLDVYPNNKTWFNFEVYPELPEPGEPVVATITATAGEMSDTVTVTLNDRRTGTDTWTNITAQVEVVEACVIGITFDSDPNAATHTLSGTPIASVEDWPPHEQWVIDLTSYATYPAAEFSFVLTAWYDGLEPILGQVHTVPAEQMDCLPPPPTETPPPPDTLSTSIGCETAEINGFSYSSQQVCWTMTVNGAVTSDCKNVEGDFAFGLKLNPIIDGQYGPHAVSITARLGGLEDSANQTGLICGEQPPANPPAEDKPEAVDATPRPTADFVPAPELPVAEEVVVEAEVEVAVAPIECIKRQLASALNVTELGLDPADVYSFRISDDNVIFDVRNNTDLLGPGLDMHGSEDETACRMSWSRMPLDGEHRFTLWGANSDGSDPHQILINGEPIYAVEADFGDLPHDLIVARDSEGDHLILTDWEGSFLLETDVVGYTPEWSHDMRFVFRNQDNWLQEACVVKVEGDWTVQFGSVIKPGTLPREDTNSKVVFHQLNSKSFRGAGLLTAFDSESGVQVAEAADIATEAGGNRTLTIEDGGKLYLNDGDTKIEVVIEGAAVLIHPDWRGVPEYAAGETWPNMVEGQDTAPDNDDSGVVAMTGTTLVSNTVRSETGQASNGLDTLELLELASQTPAQRLK